MTGRVLLFDFFGTLVGYSNSRTEQGYHRSHALAREYGATTGYDEFLRVRVEVSETFDRRSDADDSEFSMDEACSAFLERLLGRAPSPRETEHFAELYVAEWDTGVTYVDAGVSLTWRFIRPRWTVWA